LSLLTSSISVDEGSLTGESVTVQKVTGEEARLTIKPNAPVQDQHGIVFSGSMISSGSADAVVIRTGMETEIGKVWFIFMLFFKNFYFHDVLF